MKEYDLAFGMGFSCGASTALRAAGLQYASFPFDWLSVPSVLSAARLVESDFVNWFDAEDLELRDVVRKGWMYARVYRNRRTRFGFPHDFGGNDDFSACYPRVRDKYERRIRRFYESMRKSRRVLVVCLELPVGEPEPRADLVEARRILSAKFPQVQVDIQHFHLPGHPGGLHDELIADGIRSTAVDYGVRKHGVLTHNVNGTEIVRFLRANYSVTDLRTAEERVAFAERKRAERLSRWGESALQRRVNRFAYGLYRRLEAFLADRRVLPQETEQWMWGPETNYR